MTIFDRAVLSFFIIFILVLSNVIMAIIYLSIIDHWSNVINLDQRRSKGQSG